MSRWLAARNGGGVLTSDNEGEMPVCLMEAAACGVPVTTTARQWDSELVADGVTGILTPPGSAAGEFAAALEVVLTDQGVRQRMRMCGAAARVRRFSVARQADSLLELWGRILAEVRRVTPCMQHFQLVPTSRAE